jgi:hypothetical protein
MERKFSFVVNCTDADNYALVMTCWKLDEEGNRVDQQSEIKTNISLEDCFVEQKKFVDKWQQ